MMPGAHRATTAHLAAAYPFVLGQDLGTSGIVIGRNLLGGAFTYDPFDFYRRGVLTNPNMVVIGQIGRGKSSFVKSYVWRQAVRGRRAWIIDPKGEYGPLARAWGVEPIKLRPRGAVRLNPLDLGATGSGVDLLASLAEASLGRPLLPRERTALELALTAVSGKPGGRSGPTGSGEGGSGEGGSGEGGSGEGGSGEGGSGEGGSGEGGSGEGGSGEGGSGEGGSGEGGSGGSLRSGGSVRSGGSGSVPTLPMVVEAMLNPSASSARTVYTDAETLLADGRDVALELRRMVHGDLAGMFDGPTTAGIDLDSPLVVLDLSAVYGSAALGILMTCATAWLSARLSAHDGQLRLLVVDEAWAILANVGVARWLQAVWKLSRAYGVANMAVLHHLSDLAATGATGSETVKLAQGLLADSETVVSYAQPQAEVERSAELLGLSSAEADLLPQLGRGVSLWKVGRQSFLVEHHLSDFERRLVDTDADMTGTRSGLG